MAENMAQALHKAVQGTQYGSVYVAKKHQALFRINVLSHYERPRDIVEFLNLTLYLKIREARTRLILTVRKHFKNRFKTQ